MALASQRLEGGIPSFTSTLSRFALQKNRFRVLSDLHLDKATTTAIFLHDNLLSCDVPWCGNATVGPSNIAIGNSLRRPKGEFPAWVSKYEHDSLFWVSGKEGMSLLIKIIGAVGFFMFVVVAKLRRTEWLRATSRWQIGPTTRLQVVQASSLLVSCLVKASLFALVFLMLLLFWDLYACPQTLAIASACLRSSACVRALVFLCWCKLSFHSQAVEHLTTEAKDPKKQWTAKIFLLWLLWCTVTVVASTVAILYQVSRSIPGFLPVGKIWSLVLKTCIGTIQGVVGGFIVPFLASRMTSEKHVFTTASNLIMNCLIPGLIIMYLDTGCLGRWVALWKPCRSNKQMFQSRLICNTKNQRDCRNGLLDDAWQLDVTVVHSSDICDPHFSWSAISMSSCIHISLLRLQEIWLAKFVTTGVVMPGFALMRDASPMESGAVLGNMAIYMAYAMVSSGHLPLVMPMLLLAFLAEGLVVRVAWAKAAKQCFERAKVQDAKTCWRKFKGQND